MYNIDEIKNKIICGDCLEELPKIPDNSIDSIATDPPAGIGFMNKKWDNKGSLLDFQDFIYQVFSEAIRVLKPGGHILVWALPKTSHHTAMGIERAGFEIRDKIFYVFSNGFPKSLNIGLSIDKYICEQELEKEIGKKPTKEEIQEKLKKYRKIIGKNPNHRTSDALYKLGFQGGRGNGLLTKGYTKWEGYGTGLKPSVEEWILARKPLSEKTIVQNVLKWGTGGLNIDGCKINNELIPEFKRGKSVNTHFMSRGITFQYQGRYPSHLILDGSEEVEKIFPYQKSGNRSSKYHIGNNKGEMYNHGIYGKYKAKKYEDIPSSSGSASRFFKHCPITEEDLEYNNIVYGNKANRQERGENNNHPTVKSLALMRYLVKLITPKNGICLDMFLGSGTTAMACVLEGFDFIGIEKEKEYVKMAEERISSVPENLF